MNGYSLAASTACALVLAASPVFAGKVTQEDCPCFDAPVNFYEHIDNATCATDFGSSIREKNLLQAMIVDYWLEDTPEEGEACAVNLVVWEDNEYAEYECSYRPYSVNSIGGCQSSPGDYNHFSDLTPEQIRACWMYARSAEKYVRSLDLPECP